MRLLAPAASAALIAVVALSGSAALGAAGTQSPQAGFGGPPRPNATATGRATPAGAPTAAAPQPRGAAHEAFAWPLSPRPAVLRRFDQPQDQWSPGHRGVDLSSAVGQPVLSAGGGVVVFSGMVAGRGVLTVRHPGGLRTTYDPVDERVATGAVVHQGDRIGVVSPGHCAPIPCLHWGAISGPAYRDPLSLLGSGRPVLLPLG